MTPRPHILRDCWCGVDHSVSPEVTGEQLDELIASGWHPAPPVERDAATSTRPLFYVLCDAQTELHLSRAWRWTKLLLPERWFRHTKLAYCNQILAHALAETQPGWEVKQ